MIDIGTPISALSTPVPVVDEDVVAINIGRVQRYMDEIGLSFRPHIKTHKIPALARRQLNAGAKGITCQKISEATVFADAGIDDILITYNIIGEEKLKSLKDLHGKTSLSVVADNDPVIEGLAKTFSADNPLTVLVECDTGFGRCGVQSPEAALKLAQRIDQCPTLRFGGLMSFPSPFSEQRAESFYRATIDLLREHDLSCPVVSHGGTPSLFKTHEVPSATEHRAGTYIYNDRAMMRDGHCGIAQCALFVLSTVISCPTENRCVLDAGSKTLTSDLFGFDDFGLITDYPGARITSLSEEHAVVDVSECGRKKPSVGEKVKILPNHVCVVSNMFDRMIFHRDGLVTNVENISARGLVW
ncbi:MAG: D-TA family PLP-dependent enzyme [Stappiaceae bacterium]